VCTCSIYQPEQSVVVTKQALCTVHMNVTLSVLQDVCCQPISDEASAPSLNGTRVSEESAKVFGYVTNDGNNKQVAADGYVTIDVPSGDTTASH
jgi:hypothetical protein